MVIVVYLDSVGSKEYTEEELSALNDLKQAGILDSDIEELIDDYESNFEEYEYYDNEDDDYVVDDVSERGGPRRRKRPKLSKRRKQPRLSLLQMIQKRFFLVGRKQQQRPYYGAPKRPNYKGRGH